MYYITGCASNEYWSGYNCLVKDQNFGPCHLYTSNPPASGKATCQSGGGYFWYIHVGGKRTDWITGTDAMCLSTASKPIAFAKGSCQYAWTAASCNTILKYAGCIEKEVAAYGKMII